MLRWPGDWSPHLEPRRTNRGAETRAADSGRGGGPQPGRSLCGVPEGYVPTTPREEDGTPGGGSACGYTRACPAGELVLKSAVQHGHTWASLPGLSPQQASTHHTHSTATMYCSRGGRHNKQTGRGCTHAAGARWWTQCTPHGPRAPATKADRWGSRSSGQFMRSRGRRQGQLGSESAPLPCRGGWASSA